VYCDGEIGPELLDGKAAVRWAGDTAHANTNARIQCRAGASGASDSQGAAADGVKSSGSGAQQSKLLGFTTIVTALAAGA